MIIQAEWDLIVSSIARANSWMWEHSRLHHNGERGPHSGLLDFLPSVTGVHNMPLNRTLDEGVRVKNLVDNRQLTCMNSKNEYYRTEYIRLNYDKLV